MNQTGTQQTTATTAAVAKQRNANTTRRIAGWFNATMEW